MWNFPFPEFNDPVESSEPMVSDSCDRPRRARDIPPRACEQESDRCAAWLGHTRDKIRSPNVEDREAACAGTSRECDESARRLTRRSADFVRRHDLTKSVASGLRDRESSRRVQSPNRCHRVVTGGQQSHHGRNLSGLGTGCSECRHACPSARACLAPHPSGFLMIDASGREGSVRLERSALAATLQGKGKGCGE